jgi:hypothetical protein
MLLLASVVTRMSEPFHAHGGLFLLDLFAQKHRQLVSWTDLSIDWAGDGGERGLRGICFHRGRLFIVSASSLLEFDNQFRLVRQVKAEGGLLTIAHEMCAHDSRLFISSTGTDSVVVYDLDQDRFTLNGKFFSLPNETHAYNCVFLERTVLSSSVAVPYANSHHINSVFHDGNRLYASSGFSGDVFVLSDDLELLEAVPVTSCPVVIPYMVRTLSERAPVRRPEISIHPRVVRTHNVYPYCGGYLENFTDGSSVLFLRDRRIVWSTMHPEPNRPLHGSKQEVLHAVRKGWARGLCFDAKYIFSGSSPSSVITLNALTGELQSNYLFTDDARDCVHGLELVPSGFLPYDTL